MDIQEVFWKENSKEQSDKSTGEESDTDGSLSRADKSKTYMTCSSQINYLQTEEDMSQEKFKLQES